MDCALLCLVFAGNLSKQQNAAIQSKNEDDLNLVLMKCGSANRAIAERVNNFKVQLGAR